jgi:hypothetical protein
MLCTPQPTGDESPLARTFTRKYRITMRTSTFDHVSNTPVILKLIVRRYDTITVPSHS